MSYDKLTADQLVNLYCLLTGTQNRPLARYTITHHPYGVVTISNGKTTLRFITSTREIYKEAEMPNNEEVYLHKHEGAHELCVSYGITFPVIP